MPDFNPAEIVIAEDNIQYVINDGGLFNKADTTKPVVDLQTLTTSGYTMKDGKVFDSTNKEVTITNDWLSTFSKPADTHEVIVIDNTEYKLDKDGNAVDSTGKVYKTSVELESLANTVYIDNKPYTLDKDGNVLNPTDNSIYLSKADFDKMVEENEKGVVSVKELQDKTNIVLLDEGGKPIEYENTPDGITQYVTDAYKLGAVQKAEEAFNDILSRYPWLPQIVDHFERTGTLDGFDESPDYSDISVKDDDKDQHRAIIIQAKLLRGETKESAEDIAKYYIDNGKSSTIAKQELAFLQKHQQDIDVEQAQLLANNLKAEREARRKTWGIDVDNTGKTVITSDENTIYDKVVRKAALKTGEGTEIKIPPVIKRTISGKVTTADPKQFFDYIYTVKNYNIEGQIVPMTQYDYDIYEDNKKQGVDKGLIAALQMFTGKSYEDIIKNMVKQQKFNEVKKYFTTRQSTSSGNTGVPKIELPPIIR